MDDKTIMDNILTGVKSSCDLMMHGTIESSDPSVHRTFTSALSDCLSMQNTIYTKMSEKGWYPQECASQSDIDQAKQKFSGQTS